MSAHVAYQSTYVYLSLTPSCLSPKSRSLNVGLAFSISCGPALLLYVEPLRSYFSWYRRVEGSRLFITTIRMFVLPHCRGEGGVE